MTRVLRRDSAATARLMAEALPLLTAEAQALVGSVQVHVCDCRRGRANWRTRVVRVPSWVFKDQINFAGKGLISGGAPFAAYYLAHELAHIHGQTSTHNAQFMAAFQALCPLELQWYEARYKPRLAAAAGIAAQPVH